MTCFTSLPCLSSHLSRCRKRTSDSEGLDDGGFAAALLPRFMASFCGARASTTSLRQMRMLASRVAKVWVPLSRDMFYLPPLSDIAITPL